MAIRPNQACIIISVIWLVPACFQIPWAVYHRQEDFLIDQQRNIVWTVCYPAFPSANFERGFFLGVVFLTCYLMPLCLLGIFYGMIGVRVWRRSVAGIAGSKAEKSINRSKIRIVRMLVAVTTVFALSWLPLYTIRLLTLFGPPSSDIQKALLRDTIVPVAQWLGSANSCANPFIYCYFSEQFRKAILTTFRRCRCCARLLEDQGSPRTQCSRVILEGDKDGRKQSAIVIAGANGKVNV
ncbi:hypothetical protein LSH36_339g03014 [Paralvinella palmiformis]|uniref:G-protein coupled receptors family 1 profile domain-containing protein n=1 Tax=Paralvinella palmiformis TaxID=53620 RepID=A0AAD9JGQ9_9ANNE|nr:hypothetical protein LSH36_339g03014 [Paralvinella palmiformis]